MHIHACIFFKNEKENNIMYKKLYALMICILGSLFTIRKSTDMIFLWYKEERDGLRRNGSGSSGLYVHLYIQLHFISPETHQHIQAHSLTHLPLPPQPIRELVRTDVEI